MNSPYADALEYLYSTAPMFQRVGASAYKADLQNTVALCEALDNPQRKFKSIHVAGTNGKGSTSHMLAAILQSAGYRTGLYTSPHLKQFTERIKIDGREISEDFVVRFVNKLKPQIEKIKPSFFEITVGMAFSYFAVEEVDIAVIEVGLGGRLDSTNIITPELAVITNIGWDHKDILGDTLEKIAFEKAGVIKPGIPVVVSERQAGIDPVFQDRANTLGAPLYFAGDDYTIQFEGTHDIERCFIRNEKGWALENIHPSLRGFYQVKNICGVVKAIEVLTTQGVFTVSDQHIVEGIEHTVEKTGLKGRWQKLADHPLIICDTGHNESGVREVVTQIARQSYNNLHIVWGAVRDKDISDILRLLPQQASYYFCQAKIPRALEADKLAALAHEAGLSGIVVPDINDAIRAAKAQALPGDFIFIGGSTFVVAEIEEL